MKTIAPDSIRRFRSIHLYSFCSLTARRISFLVMPFLLGCLFWVSLAHGADCPGNVNNDGSVDETDLAILAGELGRTTACLPPLSCAADINEDDDVDGADLASMVQDFGRNDCDPQPTLDVSLSPPNIAPGESSVLVWKATNATSCSIDQNIGSTGLSGAIAVSHVQTTTYTVTAQGPYGTVTESVTLNVHANPPTVTLAASAEMIVPGASLTLTWDSTYTEDCVILPDIGNVPVSGSMTVSPFQDTTYTITAMGSGVTSTAQVSVRMDNKAVLVINTIAGRDDRGHTGDNGPAVSAQISPYGVVADSNDNLYVNELDDIRKISPNGVITTVAGTGTRGHSGDDGPATAAMIDVAEMATDSGDNLYLLRQSAYASYGYAGTVRKIDTHGTITTHFSDETLGFDCVLQHMAVDPAGNVFVSAYVLYQPGEPAHYKIYKIDPDRNVTLVAGSGSPDNGGDGGPAVDAGFDMVLDLAVDRSGRLYILERVDASGTPDFRVIRKIDTQGTISMVAGGGESEPDHIPALEAKLGSIEDIVTDPAGNLYLIIPASQIIQKLDADGMITTVSDDDRNLFTGLPGDTGHLAYNNIDDVGKLWIDHNGYWYLVSSNSVEIPTIRKVAPPSGFAIMMASSMDEMVSYSPDTIISGTVAPGSQVSVNGFNATVVGDTFYATVALTIGVNSILAEASNGGTIVGYDRITIIHMDEVPGTLESIAGGGSDAPILLDGKPALFASFQPRGLDLTDDNTIYLTTGHNVYKISPDGLLNRVAGAQNSAGFSGDGGPALDAYLNQPMDIIVDASGNIYITDEYNYRVRKIDSNGIITTVAGTGATEWNGHDGPAVGINMTVGGLVLDSNGNLLIADPAHYRILKMDTSGNSTYFMGQFNWMGSDTVTAGQYMGPFGMVIRDDGKLFVADKFNQVVWHLEEYGSERIQFAGIYCMYCGHLSTYNPGPYPPLIEAHGMDSDQTYLGDVIDAAIGPDNAVYLLDTDINTIRKVDANGKMSTIAGALENCRLSVYECPQLISGTRNDGAPAQLARLSNPYGIAVGPDGSLYFTDNGLVQRIKPAAPTTYAGTVTDAATGSPVAGATVSAQWFGVTYTTLTAADGSFSFTDIHATEGQIDFMVRAPGFAVTRFARTATNGSLDSPLALGLITTPPLNVVLYYPFEDIEVYTNTIRIDGRVSHAARVIINGTVATMDGLRFEASVPLADGANTISIEARDLNGQRTVIQRQVTSNYQAPVVDIQASAAEINYGDPVTLQWSSSNAVHLSLDQGFGEMPEFGSLTFIPNGTATYTITAENPPNTVSASVTVVVNQEAPALISVSPQTIWAGQSATLMWSCGQGYTDAVSINNIGAVAPSGSTDVMPNWGRPGTYTYTITATGPSGTAQATDRLVVLPVTAPEALMSADPGTIAAGQPTTLNWYVAGADSVTIDQGIGSVSSNGSIQVWPVATTTYSLTAIGTGGTQNFSTTVTVAPRPTITASMTPAIIPSGGQADLTWQVDDADRCDILPGYTDVAPSGILRVYPQQTTEYTIVAYGPGGVSIKSVLLKVADEPTATLTADEIIIDNGDSTRLSWTATNATQRTISPEVGEVAFNGFTLVRPAQTTLYTLTASGDGGTAHAYVRVHVRDSGGYGDPTPAEQAHIEAINRARANPTAEAARLGIDLNEGLTPGTIAGDPLPPVACSAQLLEAARLHSRDMMDLQYYDHVSQDGRTMADRIQDAGFDPSLAAENLDQSINDAPLDEVAVSLSMHDQLFVDAGVDGRGHRLNILGPGLKEVGVGISRGPHESAAYGALLTCNFATLNDAARSYVLGVVYDDVDGNGRYTDGEGINGADIRVVETGDSTVTASAGGYRVALTPGQYTLQATLPDGRVYTQPFTMPAYNKKVDFTLTPLPVIDLGVSPQGLANGETATLSWVVTGATSCSIDQGIGSVTFVDSTDITPSVSTTYTLTATGDGGTATRSITVWVDTEAPTASQITPSNGATVNSPSGRIIVTVTVADNESGFCGATLLDDQGRDVSDLLSINGNAVSWSADMEGALQFTLVLEDCAGNTADIPIGFVSVAAPEGVDFGLDPRSESGAEFVGGGICITNGNMVESRGDLALSSPNDLGLGFNAHYNSRYDDAGDLGHGWTHTYAVNLASGVLFDGQTYIRIVDATGRALYFYDAAPYNGAFNEKSQLLYENGQYIWHRLNGARYGFTTDGRLDWIDDAVGNRLDLAYNGDRLDTVTDTASGRILTFTYDGSLISSITGPATAAVADGVWVSFSHDNNDNLETVTYADGSGIVYTYDDPGDPNNLTLKENAHDHELARWAYNSQDRAVGSTMPDGTGADIDYPGGNQVLVTDAYGVQRTYTLVQIGRRTKVTAMQGQAVTPYRALPAVRWQYDEQLNLEEIELAGGTSDNPMHTIHRYENFDLRGNPQTVIRAWNTLDEQVVTFTYHPDINALLTQSRISVVDSGQLHTSIYDYDDPSAPGDDPQIYNQAPTGRVHQVIEQGVTRSIDGSAALFFHTKAMTYDNKGQRLSLDGPLTGTADTTTYAYDPVSGDQTGLTRPLVGTNTYGDHDAAGQPHTITDINGVVTTRAYDGRGRIIETNNQANGGQSTSTYDRGLLQQTSDPDGITRSFAYDPASGRLDTITDHMGNTQVYAYDAQGNRTDEWRYNAVDQATGVSRQHRSYQHPDSPGLLYRTFSPDPNDSDQDVYTEFAYDLAGNTLSAIDPKGAVQSYQYDAMNRVIEITEPGDGLTFRAYDHHGNLETVIDAENQRTTYGYDDLGRRLSETSPDTGTIRYRYDAVGSRIESLDSRGIHTTYTPDVLGRTRQIDYPDHNGLSAYRVTYTYDTGVNGKGRMTAMSDASGNTTWDYSQFDDMGIVSKTVEMDGAPHTIFQTLTPGGRITQLTYPSAREVHYERNECTCNISGMSTTYQGQTTVLAGSMGYQAFGPTETMDIGDAGTPNVSNQYGQSGLLQAANPDTPNARHYTYDAGGNQMNIKVTAAPWQSQSFTYDNLDRIETAVGVYGEIAYTYDKTGNWQTRTQNNRSQTYTYVPGSNRLQQISSAVGDPVEFGYDANGNTTTIDTRRLIYNQANRLAAVEDDTTPVAAYLYNGLGQRAVKRVGGVSTYFYYDFDSRMISETTENQTLASGTEYIYRGKGLHARADVETGGILSYHTNYLGAVQQLTDSSGTVVWEAVYKPYGEATVHSASTVQNNWRLPGQYYDEETGLHYNFFRYYNPSLGRFMTPDRIGLEGGMNRYVYVGNNPVNTIDPLGLAEYIVSMTLTSVSTSAGPGFLKVDGWVIDPRPIGKPGEEKKYRALSFTGVYVGLAVSLPITRITVAAAFKDNLPKPNLYEVEGKSWVGHNFVSIYGKKDLMKFGNLFLQQIISSKGFFSLDAGSIFKGYTFAADCGFTLSEGGYAKIVSGHYNVN